MKKKIMFIVIGLLTLLGLGLIIGLLVTPKSNLKEINPTFTRGGLNSTGEWVETKGSIYTKDMFEAQGLETTLDFEYNINYEIYFYNKDRQFVYKTDKLTTSYVNENWSEYVFARIVITPNWNLIDTNTYEIGLLEVYSYSSQLTIKVNKTQKEWLSANIYNDKAYEEFITKIYFDEGMTWKQYINSDFVIDGFSINSDGHVMFNGKRSVTGDNGYVYASDIIKSEYKYVFDILD